MACPICNKSTAQSYRPFCSKRCADIDLGKWLNEEYSTPAVEDEALEDAISEAQSVGSKKDGQLH
ncbi:DNA gyrase inhibitor YacG [Cognatishimia activa]|uniref:DNA gyrase inhibitor YacG n=1 Tax=Cognatishimia activa TaxID=1715691 RepID=UPI00222E4BBC|nr:DNA gyrase inhibitor YacG [Cognatishimia activa]UZD90054.1 DNA gyrase inhibitor YacG [Cognatishimia activa]